MDHDSFILSLLVRGVPIMQVISGNDIGIRSEYTEEIEVVKTWEHKRGKTVLMWIKSDNPVKLEENEKPLNWGYSTSSKK